MKSLELQLKKRLLIVEDAEHGSYFPPRSVAWHIEKDGEIWKMISRGSDLTEETAATLMQNLLESMDLEAYENYNVTPEEINNDHWSSVADSAVDSFVSAILFHGYHWGVNPLQSTLPTDDPDFYDNAEDRDSTIEKWQQAESRTFHPERTIIFEIVE